MIKPYPIKNSAAMGRYFAEETASMRWSGKVADFLEIRGRTVTRPDLTRAAAGYCPLSGKPLYQRRSGSRRLGWDIIFMPPKSISVAALVGAGGDRIIRAHLRAVESTVNLLAEPAAAVKTRSPANFHLWQTTGAMLFTQAVHRTNREKEPHLHSHVLVMNTTLTKKKVLMGLETRPLFERFEAMERLYNHELARNLRRDGIDVTTSDAGDAIIAELESSEPIQRAFAKAHARVLKDAASIAEEIQGRRLHDGLIPLHSKTLAFLSKQIANDRYRPAKEAGIEKKITRFHWRLAIDRVSLELIDRCCKPSKHVRLRTIRNEKTQSVILPSIMSQHLSTEFPHRTKRNITAVQVMIRSSRHTPDLSAKEILESALRQSAKIADRQKRIQMESQIKAGLALAGLRTLNTLEPTGGVKVNDPVLSRVLFERLSPTARRIRLSETIDIEIERRNERQRSAYPVALTEALSQHFEHLRTAHGRSL